MADALSIVIAQLNPTVGDLDRNVEALRVVVREAAALHVDLVVAPELCIAGYPPEDLVMRPAFQAAVRARIERLALLSGAGGPAILVGAPWKADDGRLYNAALLLHDGKIAATQYKHDLPNYTVFDEKRVFAAGPLPAPILFKGVKLGVLICEDLWSPPVSAALKDGGAELLVAINASPFDVRQQADRLAAVTARVNETGLPILYVNQAGAQDELVFDGDSFALNANGKVAVRAHAFRVDKVVTRWTKTGGKWACAPGAVAAHAADPAPLYQALVTGLRDYLAKNGFQGVLLGFSGGIDSGLTAAIAADAVGGGNVHCVLLPSEFTSNESFTDAEACSALLGTRLATIPIQPAVSAFTQMLKGVFAGRAADVTEENIQARTRAVALMALSNKFGYLLLTTGNKSELAVGYATIYGDMAGGFSVLKDVYKTDVYRLARWRNAYVPEGGLGPAGQVIPDNMIAKAPTAELKHGQKDSDTLPPYDVLDDILRALVEDELPAATVVERGHALATVLKVEAMLYAGEHKRRQGAPGVRVTRRAFGRDRRYPITNRFREGPGLMRK
jgi:NAD+ synthase